MGTIARQHRVAIGRLFDFGAARGALGERGRGWVTVPVPAEPEEFRRLVDPEWAIDRLEARPGYR